MRLRHYSSTLPSTRCLYAARHADYYSQILIAQCSHGGTHSSSDSRRRGRLIAGRLRCAFIMGKWRVVVAVSAYNTSIPELKCASLETLPPIPWDWVMDTSVGHLGPWSDQSCVRNYQPALYYSARDTGTHPCMETNTILESSGQP